MKTQDKYIVPFRNEPIIITQGYNGPWSHWKIRENTDYRYCLDFALPIGTQIVAARDGTIKTVYDRATTYYTGHDFEKGSRYILSNLIEIEHEDKSLTSYQHLAFGIKEEMGLRIGDKVRQGEIIGKTGLSGWVGSIPHLHFMVYAREKINTDDKITSNLTTIPMQFTNYEGPFEHEEIY